MHAVCILHCRHLHNNVSPARERDSLNSHSVTAVSPAREHTKKTRETRGDNNLHAFKINVAPMTRAECASVSKFDLQKF